MYQWESKGTQVCCSVKPYNSPARTHENTIGVHAMLQSKLKIEKKTKTRIQQIYLVDIWVIVQGDESEGHFIPCTRLYTEFRHLGLCRPGSGRWRLRRQHLETMQESISWLRKSKRWKLRKLFILRFESACGVPLNVGHDIIGLKKKKAEKSESSHFFQLPPS